MHSMLPAPARKKLGSYRGCSPARVEITLGPVPRYSPSNYNLWSSLLGVSVMVSPNVQLWAARKDIVPKKKAACA